MLATRSEVNRICDARHHDPFSVLGMHHYHRGQERGLVVRAFAPFASAITLIPTGKGKQSFPMPRVDDRGLFEILLPGMEESFTYTLRFEWQNGDSWKARDPYSFLPIITPEDQYLFNAGDHHRIYEKLGSHVMTIDRVKGVHFAVWAPNAESVSVVGDFNGWDHRPHQMRTLGASGIWELFIPGLDEGALYKFDLLTKGGARLQKADPYATYFEERPQTAAIVYSVEEYAWNDKAWLKARSANDESRPMAIYEVHLGSWMRNIYENNAWHSYEEIADHLLPYVKEHGFTHIELLPVAEHPLDASWGYQVTGYYAATSRFGEPYELMSFIDRCHQEGIGVILDWVPAHFPKDDHALARFDGTHIYEHADPRKGEHQDWGTLIFNYGRNEVKNFLASNALFWIEKYHIDGLRVDAVASMLYLDYSRKENEWLPNQFGGRENIEAIHFLKHVNGLIQAYYPGVVTIAEESTAWPGVTTPLKYDGLGFTYKWNMGWMHDVLQYFSKEPVHRQYHQGNLTFALLYAFSEKFVLPLSHDEVVHGKGALLSKMPGDEWQQFANLRALFGFMYAFPGKKLLFMGGEFGQRAEWNFDAQLDWHVMQYDYHRGVDNFLRDCNKAYTGIPALHEQDHSYQGFEWIDFHDVGQSVIAFVRWSREFRDHVVVICNFTPVPRSGYRVGVPHQGKYQEVLNSDSGFYGGSNVGNAGVRWTEDIPSHGKARSLDLTLPPLSVLYLRPLSQEG